MSQRDKKSPRGKATPKNAARTVAPEVAPIETVVHGKIARGERIVVAVVLTAALLGGLLAAKSGTQATPAGTLSLDNPIPAGTALLPTPLPTSPVPDPVLADQLDTFESGWHVLPGRMPREKMRAALFDLDRAYVEANRYLDYVRTLEKVFQAAELTASAARALPAPARQAMEEQVAAVYVFVPHLAFGWWRLGNLERAEEVAVAAVAQVPTDADAQFMHAFILAQQGPKTDEEKLVIRDGFQKVLDLDPSYVGFNASSSDLRRQVKQLNDTLGAKAVRPAKTEPAKTDDGTAPAGAAATAGAAAAGAGLEAAPEQPTEGTAQPVDAAPEGEAQAVEKVAEPGEPAIAPQDAARAAEAAAAPAAEKAEPVKSDDETATP